MSGSERVASRLAADKRRRQCGPDVIRALPAKSAMCASRHTSWRSHRPQRSECRGVPFEISFASLSKGEMQAMSPLKVVLCWGWNRGGRNFWAVFRYVPQPRVEQAARVAVDCELSAAAFTRVRTARRSADRSRTAGECPECCSATSRHVRRPCRRRSPCTFPGRSRSA